MNTYAKDKEKLAESLGMAQSELTADVFRALLEKQGLTVPEADLRAALPPASRLLDQANRLTESQDG